MRQLSRYSDWLRAGRSGIESRWGRDFPPVQTGPGAHPASCKMLNTHPLLVPRSWKSTAIPLPILWATPGLQRDHFTFILLYEAGHNSQFTQIKRGAVSLVYCTEYPQHPLSPSSSNRLSWQHSICPCICSPSLRYPGENANHVCHLTAPQSTG